MIDVTLHLKQVRDKEILKELEVKGEYKMNTLTFVFPGGLDIRASDDLSSRIVIKGGTPC